ncbi:MAG: iron-siderophore ABC transporter substrate-binding protein [Nocardioides sp.]|uniref:iron-siderophore ABC transporter substrate-binding protein n=1 Tax=Nocardioides sp. TaxID=35761 RepID=UPI003F0BBBDB
MKRTIGAACVSVLLALTACSTGSTSNDAQKDAEPTTAVDADAFPVTIEHAFGETTIEAEPTRVATVGWTDQDHALALGVVPVGATKLTWGGNDAGSSDWFDAALEEAGAEAPVRYDDTDGTPVAEIAELAPDLILATNSGITEKDYKKLSEIAPVVAYPDAPWVTPWRTSFETVAKALGRSSLGEEILADTEQAIADAGEANPELADTSFLFTYLTTADLSTVGVYAEQDPRVEIMSDFGLVPAPVVSEVVEDGQFYGSVSAEKAATLEADVLLTYAETDQDLATYTKDRLLGRIPALARGAAYAEVDKELGLAVTNPTPLSIPVIVESFLPHVVEAAGNK